VRALKIPIGEPVLKNNRTACAWTVGHTSGTPPFRVVNHTISCVGPNLVIFASPLPVASWPLGELVTQMLHDEASPTALPVVNWPLGDLVTQMMHDEASPEALPVVSWPLGERVNPMLASPTAPPAAPPAPPAPLDAISWLALPEEWLSADRQSVRLRVANGTLVPLSRAAADRTSVVGAVRTEGSLERMQRRLHAAHSEILGGRRGMLPSPAPSPPEPPPLDKMVVTVLARALGTKAKGGALAGPLIVHAAFGELRFDDDAMEERWASSQLKAVFQARIMISLVETVVIVAILNILAETVEAEKRALYYDRSFVHVTLTTLIVAIGFFLWFEYLGKGTASARRSRAMGWVGCGPGVVGSFSIL
jgi:hypothetical protein